MKKNNEPPTDSLLQLIADIRRIRPDDFIGRRPTRLILEPGRPEDYGCDMSGQLMHHRV